MKNCPRCKIGQLQQLKDESILICQSCEHFTSNGIRALYILLCGENLKVYMLGEEGIDVKSMWYHFKHTALIKNLTSNEQWDAFLSDLKEYHSFVEVEGVNIVKLE